MRLYIDVTALWAAVYRRDGSDAVTSVLDTVAPPFSIPAIHRVQIVRLLNEKHRNRATRNAAITAAGLWRHKFTEGIFQEQPPHKAFSDWDAAFRMVQAWQSGKQLVPLPQVMIHTALAVLNGFDTYLSIYPAARQAAKEQGLKVLPEVLR